MRRLIAVSLIIIVGLLFDTLPAVAAEPSLEYPDGPVISELQTASAESASQEFVEFYNPTDAEIEVDGWQVQYQAAAATTWTVKAILSGKLPARGFYLVSTADYLADIADETMSSGLAAGGGHIRLVRPDESADLIVYDLVGWGTALTPETTAAPAPTAGQSLKRVVDDQELAYIDTDNNSADFVVSDEPSPTGSNLQEEADLPEENSDDETTQNYLPIYLSELLIDPTTPETDAEDEFIELYNPNSQTVNLAGYKLETGTGFNYDFVLPAINIGAHEFLVIYARDSHLTLSNSGGAARLSDPGGTVIDQTSYETAKPGESWSFIDSNWEFSNRTTPLAANLNSLTTRAASKSHSELKPCAPDQYRNPSTNRCKKIETAAGLKACAPGQYRNPATNRCKKTETANPLKPCRPDQVRNPSTNRCIKKTSLAAAMTGTPASAPDVLSANTTTNAPKPNYLAVAAVGGGALLYSLYEFRYDIRNRLKLAGNYLRRWLIHRKLP